MNDDPTRLIPIDDDATECNIVGKTLHVLSYDLPTDGSTIEISKPNAICGCAPHFDKVRLFIMADEDASKIAVDVFYVISGEVPAGAMMVGTCRYGRLAVCVFIREVR